MSVLIVTWLYSVQKSEKNSSGQLNFVYSVYSRLRRWNKGIYRLMYIPVSLKHKLKFSINNFLSKCEQVSRKLPIFSYLLMKFFNRKFHFFVLCINSVSLIKLIKNFVVWNSRHFQCIKAFRTRSFSSLYFPDFGVNTEKIFLNLLILFECGKMRTRKTPNTDTFHYTFMQI